MTQTEELMARENAGSKIPPHPEGQFAAKCIDVIDHGMVERTWKGKTKQQHRISLRFWAGQHGKDGDGKDVPLWIEAWFTLSLAENSALRPFLQSWRGRPFTSEELKGFNVAKLVNATALIQVSHNRTATRTYANIDSIMRLPPGMEPPADFAGYVRVKDRPADGASDYRGPSEYDDSDMPFAPLRLAAPLAPLGW